MKQVLIILNIIILCNYSFGYRDNICQLNTNEGLIDLSPLTLSHGFYSGVFFIDKPNSFFLLFNICGNVNHCSKLNSFTIPSPQSCAFYPSAGTPPRSIGSISKSQIIKIEGGVSLRYFGGIDGTTQLDIFCDPSSKTVNIFDCIRVNTKVPLFKCSIYSMHACPNSTSFLPSKSVYNSFKFYSDSCRGFNLGIGFCQKIVCDYQHRFISILPSKFIQDVFEIQTFKSEDTICANAIEKSYLQCSDNPFKFDQFIINCEKSILK
ncbi:hypothetical protein ACTFIV_001153 [Dictyostelium citrinum]